MLKALMLPAPRRVRRRGTEYRLAPASVLYSVSRRASRWLCFVVGWVLRGYAGCELAPRNHLYSTNDARPCTPSAGNGMMVPHHSDTVLDALEDPFEGKWPQNHLITDLRKIGKLEGTLSMANG